MKFQNTKLRDIMITIKNLKTILLSLFIFAAGISHAEQLTVADAKTAALSFFKNSSATRSKEHAQSEASLSLAENNKNGYYVFNRQEGGMIVVADDDNLGRTVIGYTDEGSYNPDSLPVGLKGWFDQVSVLMDAVHKGLIVHSTSSGDQQGEIVIDALIKTKWNQYNPFNLLCPMDNGQQCVTGCTATAMAQVLNYWQWPVHGYGTASYHAKKIDQDLSLDLTKSYYDWDNMLDVYEVWNAGYSDNQAKAVATLMRDCGYAASMDYSADASGAFVSGETFIKHFKYSPLSKYKYRDQYTEYEWHQMIKDDLDKKRPVIYCGYSEGAGHSFIIDGYDTNTFYHVNWGWGGYQDGWFILTDLNSFNLSQGALFDLEPILNHIPNYTDDKNFSYTLTDSVLTITGTGMMPKEYAMETAPWRDQCEGIKKIVVGDGIISTVADFGCFWGDKLYCFSNLLEVCLPEGLLVLNNNSIYNSPLQFIDLPSTLQRIDRGLTDCRKLNSLHLPKSLKEIQCYGIESLSEITIDDENPYFVVKDNLLLNKEETTIVMSTNVCERLIIPEYITSIASTGIYNNMATAIVAKPMIAPTILGWGFNMQKQYGILYIKEGAVGYDSWLEKLPAGWSIITYKDESEILAKDFEWTLVDSVLTINGSGIMPDKYAMETAPWRDQCESIKKIVIGEGIICTAADFGCSWGDRFYCFSNLEEVSLPEGLLFITGNFIYDSPLDHIDLPSSLQKIICGFSNCRNLKKLHLPKSLKEIRLENQNIEEISIDDENPNFIVLDNVLLNKEGTSIIMYPNSQARIVIPESITSISPYAFNGNNASIIVSKPMIAPALPDYAFYFKSNYGFLYIKEGATGYESWLEKKLPGGWIIITYTDEEEIPTGEFEWTIEDGLLTITGIGTSPFDYNNRPYLDKASTINRIYISEGIHYLGFAPFWGFSKTTEIELPSTLKEIESQSFGYTGITKIVCHASSEPIIYGDFVGMKENGILQVPEGSDYSGWLSHLPAGWTIEYFEQDQPEAIQDIIYSSGDDSPIIYNLQGRQVEDTTPTGIYIINGKKVVIQR